MGRSEFSFSQAQAAVGLEPRSILLWASVSPSMKQWAQDLFTDFEAADRITERLFKHSSRILV